MKKNNSTTLKILSSDTHHSMKSLMMAKVRLNIATSDVVLSSLNSSKTFERASLFSIIIFPAFPFVVHLVSDVFCSQILQLLKKQDSLRGSTSKPINIFSYQSSIGKQFIEVS